MFFATIVASVLAGRLIERLATGTREFAQLFLNLSKFNIRHLQLLLDLFQIYDLLADFLLHLLDVFVESVSFLDDDLFFASAAFVLILQVVVVGLQLYQLIL